MLVLLTGAVYAVYHLYKVRVSRWFNLLRVPVDRGLGAVWFSLTKTKMVKNEKITNSLTKTKTKTKKWWKLKRENRKGLKTKTKKLKTKTKTKMPKQQNLSLDTIWGLRVLRPYGVESVTNGGRYLGRSSTRLRQQVWYSVVVGKTKNETKKYYKTKTKLKLKK